MQGIASQSDSNSSDTTSDTNTALTPDVQNSSLSDSTATEDSNGKTNTKSSLSPMTLGTNGQPTVSNPSLFTYQTISPKVDTASGALTQGVPLDIPPGRNGMQPSLSLNYNSQNLDDNSIVGYGWSLSIPYIERINKIGSDQLFTDTYFSSSINGELASSTSTSTPGVYYARVDDGSFVKYVCSNNTWTAYDKNGTRYEYGTTTQSRQFDVASSTAISRWYLEEVRDVNDNYIKYSYTKENNQIFPSQILYTGHGSTDGVMSVSFSLASSSVPYASYKYGFQVITDSRVSEIDAQMNGHVVRKYALSYSVGNNNHRSLLSSVQETGQNIDGTQLTLPAMTFQYASTSVTWSNVNGFGHHADQANVSADANGDGINDTAISGSVSCGGSPAFGIDGVGVTPPPSYSWHVLVILQLLMKVVQDL